jgi:uncharacterized protein (TIGR00299 family) protein
MRPALCRSGPPRSCFSTHGRYNGLTWLPGSRTATKMQSLYLDIFSGISGDMFIGAMLDLGLDFHHLERELQKLGIHGYHLHSKRARKATIEGVKFDVHLAHDHEHDEHHEHEHGKENHLAHEHRDEADEHDHEHKHSDHHEHSHGHQHQSHSHSHRHDLEPAGHIHTGHQHEHEHHHHEGAHPHSHPDPHHHHGRTFAEIEALISWSDLSPWVKEKSISTFRRIALAEGKVHGQPPEQVHFHEVGALDSIVDIVGAAIALEALGKPRVFSAPVVEGTGFINCAHGRFPIPAPATLNILAQRGAPLSQCDEPSELVTPTGAAILAEFAESFGPMQNMVPEKVGFGLGTRNNKTRPNVLRAVLGHKEELEQTGKLDWETDTIAVLETNLDDINSEILGYVVEKCFASGALDVFHTAIQMKKNRPGVLFTVLCPLGKQDALTELLLRETTALGVRRSTSERRKLRREIRNVKTAWGEVAIKIGTLNGNTVQASPEYESCKALAEKTGAPLKDIYSAALSALNKT